LLIAVQFLGGIVAVKIENNSAVGEAELAQRVAILKRFRELLIQQRERFHNYLVALEKQQAVIGTGSAEELLTHVEMEEQIVADIFSIQKVIDPLEAMYHAAVPYSFDDDVSAIKITLESLKNQAIAQSSCNRDLLSARMADIRSEIAVLGKSPLSPGRSAYRHGAAASIIDIQG
jgi:hypothetical protein